MLLSPPGCGHPTAVTSGTSLYSTAGGFAPVSGAVQWWQAYTDITFGVGSAVASMASQSGGVALARNSQAFQPSLQSAALNGHDTILFDGVDKSLSGVLTQANPMTLYLLIRQLNWNNGNVLFAGSTTAGLCVQSTSSPRVYFDNGGSTIVAPTQMPVNDWTVLTWVIDGASSLVRFNNGTPITGTSDASTWSQFFIGGYPTGVAFVNMEFCEGLIYPSAHNTADQDQTIAYLMHIGGL